MNISIARTYFDKNGFIFVMTRSSRWLDEQIIAIRKFTDFEKAIAFFRSNDTAEFINLTQAKQKGWM